MTQDGIIVSHTKANKKEGFALNTGGEEISVRFEPASNKIIYTNEANGKRYEQRVGISAEHRDQLHFSVRVYHANRESATILHKPDDER